MVWLKKIDPTWIPVEKKDLQVGEIWEFNGPYVELVKGGMAILVDKDGNEQEIPGQMFTCPICFVEAEGLLGFTEHVATHRPVQKPKPETVVSKATGGVSQTATEAKEDDIRAKRLAALEKARVARMAKLKK